MSSVEIRWDKEGRPTAIKVGDSSMWMTVKKVLHGEDIRLIASERTVGTANRFQMLFENGRLGEIVRSTSEPDWEFKDQGPAPRP